MEIMKRLSSEALEIYLWNYIMSVWFLGCDVYYWLIKAWEIMYMKRYVFFTSNEIKISNQKHLSFFRLYVKM